jgi:threonine dehydrogenase-like Zn-dependent dehydrogenase
MPTSMRALAFLGGGKAGVIEKPIPRPRPNDAVVRTTSALICTSDVHTVRGAIPVPEGRGLGHESVGVIHELGSAVTGFDVGQRVAVGALRAGLIFAVEGRPERQELARQFGADVVVDPAAGDVVTQILDLTDGIGVDGAIEALGHPKIFEDCIRVTKPGGRISSIGYHGGSPAPLQIPLEPFGLGMSDKKILTSLCPGGSDRLERIFALMRSGRVDPTPMTTHEFGFDEVERAFGLMETKEDGVIKPLIRFA